MGAGVIVVLLNKVLIRYCSKDVRWTPLPCGTRCVSAGKVACGV